jgi:hypothetical protein
MLGLGIVVVLCGGWAAVNAQQAGTSKKVAKVLRHVVLLKFKDGTTPEQVKAMEDGFCALPSKMPFIQGFEWGTNVSVENLNQGFTHCFLVTFTSEEDRNKYIPHPAHQEYVEILRPHLDKVLVIDYWAKD